MAERAHSMASTAYRAAASAAAQRLAPVGVWWQGISARERRWVSLAAMALTVAILWLLAIAPAWRLLQRAPAEMARLDRQLADMQRMAGLAAQLRAVPAVTQAESILALKTATERLGPKARLSAQGDHHVVRFDGLDLDELGPWLDELRLTARTRPVEMSLTRIATGYGGSLVLAMNGRP